MKSLFCKAFNKPESSGMPVPLGGRGMGRAIAEVRGQRTELVNPMSQELALLLQQSGTPQAHFSGAHLL